MKYAVEVRKTKNKGRGVFAKTSFKPGDIIERCPVILFSPQEVKELRKTKLDNYLYDWRSRTKSSLPLGYGLIYNHSYSPNARYYFNHTRRQIVYMSITDIKPGQEITVNYNFDPNDTTPLNMEDVLTGKPIVVKK